MLQCLQFRRGIFVGKATVISREGEKRDGSRETPDLTETGTLCFVKMLIIEFSVVFSDTECLTRTSCSEVSLHIRYRLLTHV